ncbi:MAG TPA: GntR family transcriptional regulator [Brevibacterium senegalense]|uniref:GntR family transcriptional regulator n=1 Tax=Brevibacterium senegalense TaxID=1033736 RepID=A0A921SPY6_9MICO|nr:GntR family transcriptional regulator [Brevibacterium senegalense]
MEFDTSSPIWVQLVDDFSRRIVTGEWPAGGRIPGVREIAVDVGVNPNTVQRALAEMEREGLCRSERTAGRFVTDDRQRIDRVRAALVQDAADDYIRRARGLGMGRAHAQDLLVQRWSDHDDGADRDDDHTTEAGGE